jgi:hypothetical protein
MKRALFADRFTSVPHPEHVAESFYDDRRGYSVTADGHPFVVARPIASTHTLTKAEAEPSDSDRAWDTVMVSTRTTARPDRDHW